MNTFIRTSSFALGLACAGLTLAQASTAFAQARMQAAPPTPAQPSPAPSPAPAPAPAGQEGQMKQIALTDKMIENALAAQSEISPIVDKLPEDAQPDPKIMAQLDGIAKKHGFASYLDYNDVTDNINLVMGGFDTDTKKYVGEDVVLKKQIDQVQADKKMSPKDKKETLGELNEALKAVTPLQFPGNATVVAKYLDKIMAAMPQDQQ